MTRNSKRASEQGRAIKSVTCNLSFTTTTKMAGLVSYGSSDEEDNMQDDVVQQEVCRKDALRIPRIDR